MADLKKEISESYGVLTDEGIALRGLFHLLEATRTTLVHELFVAAHGTVTNCSP